MYDIVALRISDDVVFVTDSDTLGDMLDILVSSTTSSGLLIKPDKCAIFYERRSGNRWCKAKDDKTPSIAIDGQLVKVYERHKPFKYPRKFLAVAGEPQIHVNSLLHYCNDLLL